MENEYKIFDVERDIKNNNSKSDLHFIWKEGLNIWGHIQSFPSLNTNSTTSSGNAKGENGRDSQRSGEDGEESH